MSGEIFEDVWDAFSDDPAKVAYMKQRSRLMAEVRDHVEAEFFEKRQMTGQQVAEKLKLNGPRVSYLRYGRISKFSLDKLVEIAARAGLEVTISTETKEMVDQ